MKKSILFILLFCAASAFAMEQEDLLSEKYIKWEKDRQMLLHDFSANSQLAIRLLNEGVDATPFITMAQESFQALRDSYKEGIRLQEEAQGAGKQTIAYDIAKTRKRKLTFPMFHTNNNVPPIKIRRNLQGEFSSAITQNFS